MKKLEDGRAGGQHDRRVHDRQRHRELHLARRRPDALRRRQGNRARRRLPRSVHRSLAGQDSGRQGRERHHVRARLVPDLRRGGRRPEHRRRAEARASNSATRPTRSTSTATTRRTCSPARARRSATRSSTSPRARSARCGSTTSSTASSISPAAGSAGRSRWTGRSSSTCDSIRSSGRDSAGSLEFYNWFAYEFWRFVFVQEDGRASSPRRSSSSRRCRRARPSTWKPSRSKSRRRLRRTRSIGQITRAVETGDGRRMTCPRNQPQALTRSWGVIFTNVFVMLNRRFTGRPRPATLAETLQNTGLLGQGARRELRALAALRRVARSLFARRR